jgi:hypothetical protein
MAYALDAAHLENDEDAIVELNQAQTLKLATLPNPKTTEGKK